MNERIKQLEKDALYFALQFRAGLNGDLTDYETEIIFREKFAELIVKECVDICNQAILQNQDTLSKLNTDELAEKMIIHGSIKQADKLAQGIKQHFGVDG